MNANKGNFQHLAYAFKTDVGKKRKNNEDALGAFPEGGIFCVADGMGGGDDGEIASAAVVKAVDDVSRRCATGAGHAAKDVATALEAGLSEASAWIWKRASSKKIGVCGSTFVGVAFDSADPARALAIHAGDSRLYLVRGKKVKQITRDHSASELMGEKDESKVNPMFRSMIVNAVGIQKTVECERTPFKVAEGDRVLICSDGLYRMVADKRIGEISVANPDVEKAVDALVAAALAGGGVDNISVVLCEIGKLPKPVAATPVPVTVSEGGAEMRATGEDDVSGSAEAGATRETMIPVLEGQTEKDDESKAHQGVEVPVGQKTSAVAPSRRLRRRVLLLLAAAFGMLAAAVLVFFNRREPQPESVPAFRPTGSAATNVVTVSNVTVRPQPTAKPLPKPQSLPTPQSLSKPKTVSCPKPVAVPVVTNRTEVVTNVPKVAVPPPKPDIPVATNMPSANAETRPCGAFVAACDVRAVAEFSDALRRICGKDESLREIDDQMRRFRESAKLCSRMRSEKFCLNAVVDLKYVLVAADAARVRLEGLGAGEKIRKFMDDWDLVASGSEKDVRVQEACARLLLNAPRLREK